MCGPTHDWLSSAQEFYFSFSPNVDSCRLGSAEGVAFALAALYCIINTMKAAESHQTVFMVCWHSKKCLSIKQGCLSCNGLMARADIVLHAGRGIKDSVESHGQSWHCNAWEMRCEWQHWEGKAERSSATPLVPQVIFISPSEMVLLCRWIGVRVRH